MIVFLEILSWADRCAWACHYQGNLHCRGRIHSLKSPVSEALLAKERKLRYRYLGELPTDTVEPGDDYEGMESREAVIEAARRDWLGVFPEGRVLLVGHPWCCDPQEVLEAPEDIRERLEELWRAVEARGSKGATVEECDAWSALMEPYEED